MVARPAPVSSSVRKLRNAQLPEFGLLRLGDIVGIDSTIQADTLPTVARSAPPFVTVNAVLGSILRAPIWVRERRAGLYVVGNVESWTIARSVLADDDQVYVLRFGRSSNWFKHALALERWLVPILRLTPRDQTDALVEQLLAADEPELIERAALSDQALARHTGESRDTIARRRKRVFRA